MRFALLMMVLLPLWSFASSTLDQSWVELSASSGAVGAVNYGRNIEAAQTVTAGMSGYLCQVDVWMARQVNSSVGFVLSIYDTGVLLSNSTPIASFQFPAELVSSTNIFSQTKVSLDTRSGYLYFDTGDVFTLALSAPNEPLSSTAPHYSTYTWGLKNGYSRGSRYVRDHAGDSWISSSTDHTFQTWVASEIDPNVTVSVIGSGSVNVSSGDYPLNTNLTLEATPDLGWLFTGWSGSLEGDYTTTPTNLVVDENKVITASFSDDADGDGILNTNETALGTNPRSSDTDNDGLSDPQELYSYDTDPLVYDMDGDSLSDGEEVLSYGSNPKVRDSDGDGFDDGFEVRTGFDPATTNSTPDLLSSIRLSIQYEFNAASGTTYRIEGTPSLPSPWRIIEDGITGEGGLVTRHYDVDIQTNRFFRAVHSATD
jgi:hypothetical protein